MVGYVPLAHAVNVCVGGACAIGQCEAGWANCDGQTANGCETNSATDVLNCGSCGTKCTFSNATPACAGGTCQIGKCNAGFGDCDGTKANGCEVKIESDGKHCGKCGHDCLGGACVAGVCKPVVLASGLASPVSIAVDSSIVYWANQGTGMNDGSIMRRARP